MGLSHVLILMISFIGILADSLRIPVWVKVPEAVIVGGKVTLECLFERPEGEQLEVVWYRNNKWFFRHNIKTSMDSKIDIHHFQEIDIAKSNYSRVIINRVNKGFRGWYRCQVNNSSQDYVYGPDSYMQVVDPLERSPRIHLEQMNYAEGATLRGYCIPPYSEVTANVTWLINGNKVESDEVRVLYDPKQNRTMLAPHVSWVVNTTAGGDVRVGCVADLFNIMSLSTSVIVHVKKPLRIMTTTPPTTP